MGVAAIWSLDWLLMERTRNIGSSDEGMSPTMFQKPISLWSRGREVLDTWSGKKW